ncbi:hypothetical protein ACFFHM_10440 [Halalkalibacter kiskunsagensis]|uniref:Uncharacterized protein n=1 Tax=Halalkalibacter kiskunsagensis TaxID=1548599 RepID=A0ABV6KC77_9BACI
MHSGKEAYFFQNEEYGFIGYHMMLIDDNITYHFSAEIPPYFYEDNKHILDEIMMNFEVMNETS